MATSVSDQADDRAPALPPVVSAGEWQQAHGLGLTPDELDAIHAHSAADAWCLSQP